MTLQDMKVWPGPSGWAQRPGTDTTDEATLGVNEMDRDNSKFFRMPLVNRTQLAKAGNKSGQSQNSVSEATKHAGLDHAGLSHSGLSHKGVIN